jgi:hypothetical protein
VIAAAVLPAVLLRGDLLPEALDDFVRNEVTAVTPEDPELFGEFGFEEGELGVYQTPAGKRAELTALRFYDDTGAFSAYRWLQSADGSESNFGKRSWTDLTGTLIHFGNYVVRLEGNVPQQDTIELMLAYLPRVRVTPDPPVLKFAPAEGVVPGSEKHILGPIALARLAPEISPSTAGFHFGSEAHYAEYMTSGESVRMLIFSYPTPQMARVQAEQFYMLDGVVAKRTGPMIAAVIKAPSPDEAERLVAKVRYQAEVTLDYREPGRHDNLGTLILDVFILCGILVLLCIAGGILVAGARRLFGRVAPGSILAAPEGDGLIHLDIDRRK